jgi:hypothetical protein
MMRRLGKMRVLERVGGLGEGEVEVEGEGEGWGFRGWVR